LPGMGPAYFTKLIHFLGPADGYILDQWTARSTNLLFGPLVYLKPVHRGWHVDDRNTSAHYERYCAQVEWLAEQISRRVAAVLPSEVEHALFAPGGWREYVKQLPTEVDAKPLCDSQA
jgi:hypothetical protein